LSNVPFGRLSQDWTELMNFGDSFCPRQQPIKPKNPSAEVERLFSNFNTMKDYPLKWFCSQLSHWWFCEKVFIARIS